MNPIYRTAVALLVMVAGIAFAEESPTPEQVRRVFGPFVKPIEAVKAADTDLTRLGRTLFHDRRLSRDQDRSCNDCHDLTRYGTNGDLLKKLREEKKLYRDAPSLYNIAGLNLYYWDGRKTDLPSQTAAALVSPYEMAMPDQKAVTKRVQSISDYLAPFQKAFPESENPVTFENLVAALNEFEKGLVTPGPIDQFLLGDDKALTEDQLKGALLFDQYDCGACHTGSTIGGQMLQKLGILYPWPDQEDTGYYEVSKNPDHKMVFRVQGLRNVEKTGPYFHDGSVRTLKRAIHRMAIHERGQRIDLEEILLIEEFLKTLTGVIPVEYIEKEK